MWGVKSACSAAVCAAATTNPAQMDRLMPQETLVEIAECVDWDTRCQLSAVSKPFRQACNICDYRRSMEWWIPKQDIPNWIFGWYRVNDLSRFFHIRAVGDQIKVQTTGVVFSEHEFVPMLGADELNCGPTVNARFHPLNKQPWNLEKVGSVEYFQRDWVSCSRWGIDQDALFHCPSGEAAPIPSKIDDVKMISGVFRAQLASPDFFLDLLMNPPLLLNLLMDYQLLDTVELVRCLVPSFKEGEEKGSPVSRILFNDGLSCQIRTYNIFMNPKIDSKVCVWEETNSNVQFLRNQNSEEIAAFTHDGRYLIACSEFESRFWLCRTDCETGLARRLCPIVPFNKIQLLCDSKVALFGWESGIADCDYSLWKLDDPQNRNSKVGCMGVFRGLCLDDQTFITYDCQVRFVGNPHRSFGELPSSLKVKSRSSQRTRTVFADDHHLYTIEIEEMEESDQSEHESHLAKRRKLVL